MDLETIVRFVLLGLGIGALYGVVAQGIVLVYRGSGVLNFAQGAFVMVGAYTYYELVERHGVMHAVQLGRYDQIAHPPQAFGKIDVAVVNRLHHAHESPVKGNGQGWKAAGDRHGGIQTELDKHFQRMMTNGRCDVQIGVGMMQRVQAPEERHGMEQPVFPITE